MSRRLEADYPARRVCHPVAAVTHGRVLVAIHLSIFRSRILQFGMAKAVVNGF